MGMNAIELKDIIDKHGKWLRSEPGGEQANLSSANLRYADLSSADLSYADLSYANLSYADLSYANLRYADLSSADLSSANLRYADLRSADLRYADLSSTKEDFYKILSAAIPEVVGLYDALMRGKINGSTYTGECACLMGTIANVRRVDVGTLEQDANRPAERWFFAISKGDTPDSNSVARITREWLEEFANANALVLPKYRIVSSVEAPQAFEVADVSRVGGGT